MAFEQYTPTQSHVQSLYAIPLRLIDDVLMVKTSDVPPRFQAELDAFCTVVREERDATYIPYRDFVTFSELVDQKARAFSNRNKQLDR